MYSYLSTSSTAALPTTTSTADNYNDSTKTKNEEKRIVNYQILNRVKITKLLASFVIGN